MQKIHEQLLRSIIRNTLLEYVVPMGFSLKSWKKYKKKHKTSNKEYAEKTKGGKWKIVHGHKKSKIGKALPGATNLSYAKASKQHAAIAMNEAVVTGRKLDRYTNIIKRHVINAIKDPEVRDHFNETGSAQFKLQHVPEMDEIDYLRDVIISMKEDPDVSASAAYTFDLHATPEQRKTSDLTINLKLPRNFPNQVLGYINIELVDSIRHELEHSGQDIEDLMDCIGDSGEASHIWSSLVSAAEYYTCPAEIKAHVAGWMKRAKSNKQPLAKVIDDELYMIYHTGKSMGYSEGDLHDLMAMMREKFHDYARRRYPQARGY